MQTEFFLFVLSFRYFQENLESSPDILENIKNSEQTEKTLYA